MRRRKTAPRAAAACGQLHFAKSGECVGAYSEKELRHEIAVVAGVCGFSGVLLAIVRRCSESPLARGRYHLDRLQPGREALGFRDSGYARR